LSGVKGLVNVPSEFYTWTYN